MKGLEMRIKNSMSIEDYYLNYRRHNHVTAHYKNRPVVGVKLGSDCQRYEVQVLDREGVERLTANRHEYLRVEVE